MTGYRGDRIGVFSGPSTSGLRLAPPFVPLPPAAAGDMLRLVGEPPCTVVLIDGVFDARPAPWHKEILVLLARGFRVIGAASMGALRAAELDGLGMIGAGRVYAAYAAGRITGDDEVAVIHAPPELGAAPLSLAQVDARATFAAAARAGVASVAAARRARALSGAIHYAERDWPAVLAAMTADGLDVRGFAAWLPAGEVMLKRRDAKEALALARTLAPTPPELRPEPPRTCFLVDLATTVGVTL